MQQAMGWDKRMLQSRAEPLCTPQLGYRGGAQSGETQPGTGELSSPKWRNAGWWGKS